MVTGNEIARYTTHVTTPTKAKTISLLQNTSILLGDAVSVTRMVPNRYSWVNDWTPRISRKYSRNGLVAEWSAVPEVAVGPSLTSAAVSAASPSVTTIPAMTTMMLVRTVENLIHSERSTRFMACPQAKRWDRCLPSSGIPSNRQWPPRTPLRERPRLTPIRGAVSYTHL